MARSDTHFSLYGWLVALWICLVAFQYGYHISVLNQIQTVLACPTTSIPKSYGLSTCIPMTEFQFGVVTSLYTVGGLFGSLYSSIPMNKSGRSGAARLGIAAIAIGSGIMGVANSIVVMGFGRFIVGVGCGISICVAPVYLAECSPPGIVHSVGVLVQLGIVFGIMITQALGLSFASPETWRFVLFFSFILGVVQYLAGFLIVESPVWLSEKGYLEKRKSALEKLFASSGSLEGPEDHDPLLPGTYEDTERASPSSRRRSRSRSLDGSHQEPITLLQLFGSHELRKPMFIVTLAMITQQLSGINAVLYYSNTILGRSLPGVGPYVSLGITVFNAIMTFPPIFLIGRLGRRKLLILSSLGMIVSSVLVGVGLDANFATLASITVITFVMSFAIGLGPVPFVMIPEVSPPQAVSTLSSLALACNWIANGLVALMFLPVRRLLSGGDENKQGRVFYLFSSLLAICTLVLIRLYREGSRSW
ncbi:general substrate transporter [Flagelloscypha sp. PMI_526]|nr:general substrate transporter [Flagelloscypha sp. PMI_526]